MEAVQDEFTGPLSRGSVLGTTSVV